MPLAESEKCQGSGDSVPGRLLRSRVEARNSRTNRKNTTGRHVTPIALLAVVLLLSTGLVQGTERNSSVILTLNTKDTGYRGVWYMNQPLRSEYRFKYSGGMATFCAKHTPFAVYCDKVRKTFFCYGGTSEDSHLKHDLTNTSNNQGTTWKKVKQVTSGSLLNHNYARRPVNAHDHFYAFWADGHGRQPSASSLCFCNKAGDVFRLPERKTEEFVQPERVN